MDRLIRRDEYGNADIIGVESADLQMHLKFDEMNKVTDALNKLAHYEDLAEQGRLVELPCAVESILYRVVDGSVYEYFLDEFNVNKSGAHSMSISHAYEGHTFFINVSCDQIGKRFYTTREAAEAKLAEEGGVENG